MVVLLCILFVTASVLVIARSWREADDAGERDQRPHVADRAAEPDATSDSKPLAANANEAGGAEPRAKARDQRRAQREARRSVRAAASEQRPSQPRDAQRSMAFQGDSEDLGGAVASAHAEMRRSASGGPNKIAAVEKLAALAADVDVEDTAPGIVSDLNEALHAAALDPDPNVAQPAIEALEQLPTRDTFETLGAVLASNAPESVKLAAIDTLTALDTRGVAAALSRGLSDPNPSVREEVAWAMGWVDDADSASLGALVAARSNEPDESIRDTMESSAEDMEWDLQ